MIMRLYKSWILLKLRFKNGNQKNVRVGYVEFTLIEQVFFKKNKPEIFFRNRSFHRNVLKALNSQPMYVCYQYKHIQK